MCGLLGYTGERRPVNLKEIQKHRGPDDFGLFEIDDCTIAHHRLAILDLDPRSKQPFRWKNWVLVFNGEIYNYLELKADLEKLGHRFETTSDTEVLIHAYGEWGLNCLPRFNGMFAFCIYDTNERDLLLVRDRFGIKPLFYSLRGRDLYFASEIKSLFSLGVPKLPDLRAIATYLAHGVYQHDSSSFFSGVQMLAPGSWLRFKQGSTRHQSWYSLPTSQIRISLDDAKAELNRLLSDSIRLQLRADVPISIALSGGLDSSSIFYRVLKDQMHSRIAHVYHWTCNGENDESEFAHAMAKTFGFPLTVTHFEEREFLPRLDMTIAALDQPFGGLNVMSSTKAFEQMLERGHKILLDGNGADEILGGYSHHIDAHESRALNYNYQPVQAAKKVYRANILSHELQNLVSPFLLERKFDDPLKDSMYNDLFGSKLRRSLIQQDLNSMRCGVEMRFPFLDHRLAEFTYSLPGDYLVTNGLGKFLLRAANDEHQLFWMKKRPVQTPQTEWLRGPFFEQILLQAESNPWFKEYNLFMAGGLQREFNCWRLSSPDNSFFPWQILMLDRWSRTFF